MPQASEELRQMMVDFGFGDPVDENAVTAFLESAGYKLDRGWCWIPKQCVSTYSDMTTKEYACLLYLVHEWDYGGLVIPIGDKNLLDNERKTT